MPSIALLWQLTGSQSTSESSPASPTTEIEVAALFHELRPALLRYLRSLGLPAADGEDVVQEAFLALFEHLRQDKPRDNLRGWVFRVSRNIAMKRFSRSGAPVMAWECWEEAAETIGTTAAQWDPEVSAAWNASRARLLAVVKALPDQDRQCLFLRAEGLRYREIAGVLNVSLGAVAASLSRSLSKLAAAADR